MAMKNFPENISQAKNLLKELIEEIGPLIDELNIYEKEAQLRTIEKSMEQFKKTNLEVPDELRELKLRLVSEVDWLNETKKEFDDFILFLKDLSQEHLPFQTYKRQPKMEIPKKNRNEDLEKDVYNEPLVMKKPREIVVDTIYEDSKKHDFFKRLIRENIIKPNSKIFRKYDDKAHEGIILEDGRIQLMENGRMIHFNTIHEAAKYINPNTENGLDFWNIKNPEYDVWVRLSIFLK